MDELVAFFAFVFEGDRFHESVAFGFSVPGDGIVYMKGEKTFRAVVSAGAF